MKATYVRLMTLALLVGVFVLGCATTPTQKGALFGGLLGSGAGAIIGHQSGKQGEGALIGGAAGALTGALIGDRVDEHRARYHEGRYSRNNPAPPPTPRGHWETRTVTTESGETYEERVWVQDH
ncbi:MAG: glycine zipper 2TM domain-containing protein [Candidatus Hydrogenedentes bacterium]|nr:glycine zipper 2TM domain-containing protein [Candidatus Hydrogenedentota bacterium]